ncbi:hypothetical protein [Hydrogenophaga pseudoflava]|uniref:hypothetical protein n=1 Tax=Hydrogenophaga pseudoflava TaxID=47421 RepID=UPI0027E5714E|nr:hypothetical protein [Hydrogenophaga pseudoflava]MDQ7745171.1 hypothetical protein [Hydrogenophaga pseudoflava]
MSFAVSLLLLAWVSLRWARHLCDTPADRYWLFVGTFLLQIGAITGLTSLAHQLTPAGWLVLQVLMAAATVALTGGWRRHGIAGPLRQGPGLRAALVTPFTGLTPWGLLLLCAIVGVLLLALARQALEPLYHFDDRMYHASRVLYWIQHATVFPFETHNIRQTLVPFGSELLFLWPVLLTKSEAVGRLVFGLALPLAAIGQYLLLRALRLGQTVALAGVLILVSTPLIVSSASGLKPEVWAVLSLLGLAYWAVSLCDGADRPGLRCFFLGVFAALSTNVRSFPAALLPGLLLILWWAPGADGVRGRLKAFGAGLLGAVVLSTLLIPLAFNTVHYHHPMGPSEVRRVVQADISPQMAYTHAVRFVSLLLELPAAPASPDGRAGFSAAVNRVMSAAGAGQPLAEESHKPWPGRYVYALPEQGTRFSLWGLLWLPVLALAGWRLLGHLRARRRLDGVAALALLAVPLLGAVLFGARWMAHSEVPARFLCGPYGLALPLGFAMLAPRLSAGLARRRLIQGLLALLLVYAAYPPVRSLANEVRQALAEPLPGIDVNEPFDEVLRSALPPGSRVLLVGDQGVRDYPLFSPGTGYLNAVIPWGARPFDAERMRRLIAEERVTHVLIQDDARVVFLWFSAVDTRGMVRWLNDQKGLRPVLLRTAGQRLYEVIGAAHVNDAPFRTSEAPAAAPLIGVSGVLQGQVGVDAADLQIPWPVDDVGGEERGFLWLGQGHPGGFGFALWSRREQEVDLRIDMQPGPGMALPGRRFMLLHDDLPVGGERRFEGVASVVVRVRLHVGRNLLSLLALDRATVVPLPNGDPRGLVVGLRAIHVEPATAPGARVEMPATSAAGLARSARLAVGRINRRQQGDGHWLTAHTMGTIFALPTEELNTYVTALMVDLLAAEGTPEGLSASLDRAHAHLNDQIEPDGLVRYHGRPGGRATRETSVCTITPDADDTALVWRIAPGSDALRSSALAGVRAYRTAEGLYRTWLSPESGYQCLNPGADPNPTDIGIQMHVLMWLAQDDPPAARELCEALRRTVDQDRLWVYYSRAPLVPVMRQPELRAHGCDLPLPPGRVQAEFPEQQIWLDAARLIARMGPGSPNRPTADEARPLLEALAADGFAAVRTNPPMLYHNDLSASVSRRYWSEDVGYAMWLRIFLGTGGTP